MDSILRRLLGKPPISSGEQSRRHLRGGRDEPGITAQDEYHALRAELLQTQNHAYGYRNLMYTAFGVLVAFGFTQDQPLLFLLPIPIVLPLYRIGRSMRNHVHRIGTYTGVFLGVEGEENWETRQSRVGDRATTGRVRVEESATSTSHTVIIILCCLALYWIALPNEARIAIPQGGSLASTLVDAAPNYIVDIAVTVVVLVGSLTYIFRLKARFNWLRSANLAMWDNLLWEERGRPLVSVVVRTHNSSEYVSTAVASALAQTFRQFELLVVDDGSSDNTLEKVDEFPATRTRVIRLDRHRGQAAAAHAGVESARGKYVAILDSDDIAHPSRLMRQVEFLVNHPTVDVVASQVFERRNDRWTWRHRPTLHDDIKVGLLCKSPIAHSSVMFRREALPTQYDPAATLEDTDLWARSIVERRFEMMRIPLAARIRRQDSVMGGFPDRANEVVGAYRDIAKRLALTMGLLWPEDDEDYLKVVLTLECDSVDPLRAQKAFKALLFQLPHRQRKEFRRSFVEKWGFYVEARGRRPGRLRAIDAAAAVYRVHNRVFGWVNTRIRYRKLFAYFDSAFAAS